MARPAGPPHDASEHLGQPDAYLLHERPLAVPDAEQPAPQPRPLLLPAGALRAVGGCSGHQGREGRVRRAERARDDVPARERGEDLARQGLLLPLQPLGPRREDAHLQGGAPPRPKAEAPGAPGVQDGVHRDPGRVLAADRPAARREAGRAGARLLRRLGRQGALLRAADAESRPGVPPRQPRHEAVRGEAAAAQGRDPELHDPAAGAPAAAQAEGEDGLGPGRRPLLADGRPPAQPGHEVDLQ
mmetsp:Transcript_43710/g.115595  ORF Transcript_43710/g.115595 Transcript_43710/m.115595 type:complete len:244 (-) Transcript_43710:257-988(-)